MVNDYHERGVSSRKVLLGAVVKYDHRQAAKDLGFFWNADAGEWQKEIEAEFVPFLLKQAKGTKVQIYVKE